MLGWWRGHDWGQAGQGMLQEVGQLAMPLRGYGEIRGRASNGEGPSVVCWPSLPPIRVRGPIGIWVGQGKGLWEGGGHQLRL